MRFSVNRERERGRSRTAVAAAILGVAIVAVVSIGATAVQTITRTFVENLESPHPVEGSVVVPAPVPHGEIVRALEVVVAPATRDETSLWTEAGVVETDGFTSAVVSLHGQFRGNPSRPGAVVAVLVPDEDSVLRALAEGEAHLVLEGAAEPAPGPGMYFSGVKEGLFVGFPRYQLFVYNTTDRSAAVNVFVYLTN